ncbi:MAG TPA: sugar transferase, partial [Gammaproteobacteria bacterium]|nr:sugar transferase [Gammaproteobacteria bacterium]
MYDFKNIFSGMREYSQIFNACTLGAMVVIIFTFFDPNIIVARAWLVLSWLLICFNALVWRFAFRRIVHWMRGKGRLMTRVLIIGANEEGQAIAQQLKGNVKAGIKIMGFADDRLKAGQDGPVGLPVLGSIDLVTTLIRQYDIQEVIVISSAISRKNLLILFEKLDSLAVPVRLSSGLYELITTGLEVQEFANVPLLSVNKVRLTGGDMVLKRALDILGATFGLIVLLPIMVIIAIAIKVDSSGPIFYRRRVIGVGGKSFDAFKFRSMCIDADERLARDPKLRSQFQANYKLKDDPRVTHVGQFLRDKSLDELPQLINVLLGQMSL